MTSVRMRPAQLVHSARSTPQQKQSPPMTQRATLGWAVVVALALLSYFVHVLNEQVQRGESRREQWRMTARSTPAAQVQALSQADIGYVRQLASGR